MKIEKLKHYLRKAATMPPHRLLGKIVEKLLRRLKEMLLVQRDRFFPTWSLSKTGDRMASDLPSVEIVVNPCIGDIAEYPLEDYLAHRFDLLGSGKVRVGYGESYPGFMGISYQADNDITPDREGLWLRSRLNRASVKTAQEIWRKIDREYHPIDWHVDFKSGYRWKESTWYRRVPYGHLPGVDVKLSWELARCQHLPQIALAFVEARGDSAKVRQSERYVREIRNTILDFIALNPPRFGVNWACTMDVAIRVINWIVACSIVQTAGGEFDADFKRIYSRSLRAHGKHIYNNLEWSTELRGNHYLADIVGLLFVSAALPESDETGCWLALAVQEFFREVDLQFYRDGANFEGSTYYHRLSAEMVLYGMALIAGLVQQRRKIKLSPCKKPRLCGARIETGTDYLYANAEGEIYLDRVSCAVWRKILGMGRFIEDITRSDGRVPQIGDNDSGRLLKINVRRCRKTKEDISFRATAGMLFLITGDYDEKRHVVHTAEREIITSLIQGYDPGSYLKGNRSRDHGQDSRKNQKTWESLKSQASKICEPFKQVYTFRKTEGGLLRGLRYYDYPEFGLYIYKSEKLYLTFRCGKVGQNGNGGHDHNDQLGITMSFDGKDIINDPGTYVYTPDPELRNRYRSAKAHFAPRINGVEPARIDRGLFTLGSAKDGECIYFDKTSVVGRYLGYGVPIWRLIEIEDNTVRIIDWSNGRPLERLSTINLAYSPSYGSLVKA